jgi:hypothetical protein
MQGKIDENGNLLILRRDKWKSQYCPKRLGRCNDGCPKFGEPYSAIITNLKGEEIHGVALKLCENDRLFFTQFKDDR